jgi:hypothetical protein
VELLIGAVLTGITIAASAVIVVSHLNATNATTWSVQLQRDLRKFNFLVNTEANEGCRLQAGTPFTAGTACAPPANLSCATVSGPATNFNILVSFAQANADPITRVVTYRLDTGRVLRDGPRILSNGQLDTANNQNNAVVLDGVTAFTPTVAADCRTATILVTLTVPTTTTNSTQTIRVATGANQFIR